MVDEILDQGSTGPLWLKNPQVAECVVREIRRPDRLSEHYLLQAFVVMANHVHLLILPKIPLRKITNDLKGVTARRANAILNRTGEPFWQDESFDHWVRNEAEFQKIRAYIEGNPVSAGLVTQPEDWPWSSANPRWRSL